MSTAASPHRSEAPPLMVVMGVSGCGKTEVGQALARATGSVFVDGDTLHPPANVAKMSAGIPLGDDDRWPWLAEVGGTLGRADGPTIIGCSALKRAYRAFITETAGRPVLFIHLAGSPELIGERMSRRRGHFMPASLLASQFAALEPPSASENAITVPIDAPLEAVVAEILARLNERNTCPTMSP